MLFRVPVLFLLLASIVALNGCTPKVADMEPVYAAGDPANCDIKSFSLYSNEVGIEGVMGLTEFLPDSAGYHRVNTRLKDFASNYRFKILDGRLAHLLVYESDPWQSTMMEAELTYDNNGRRLTYVRNSGRLGSVYKVASRYVYQSANKYWRCDSLFMGFESGTLVGVDTTVCMTDIAGRVTAEYKRIANNAWKWWPRSWYTYTAEGRLAKQEFPPFNNPFDTIRQSAIEYSYIPVVLPEKLSRFLKIAGENTVNNYLGGMVIHNGGYLIDNAIVNQKFSSTVYQGGFNTSVTQNPVYNSSGCLKEFTVQKTEVGVNTRTFNTKLVFNY